VSKPEENPKLRMAAPDSSSPMARRFERDPLAAD
jgi:hypothetical protein